MASLEIELSRLKRRSDPAHSPDELAARVLDALRHLGEALAPLAGQRVPTPSLLGRRSRSVEATDEMKRRGADVLAAEPERSVDDCIVTALEEAGFAVLSIPRVRR